jgi:hypothetical protein
MSVQHRVLAYVEIYEECRLAVRLNYDDELVFTLGDPIKEDAGIVFDRAALERFVQLAANALKLTLPEDHKTNLPELVSVA